MTDTPTKGIKTLLCPVSDMPQAKALYTALLGMAPTADSDYYVGFDAPGQHVGLLPGGGPQGLQAPTPFWEVDDIEAKLAELLAAGAVVTEAAHEVGGGRVVASVTDADGNVLGLLQDR